MNFYRVLLIFTFSLLVFLPGHSYADSSAEPKTIYIPKPLEVFIDKNRKIGAVNLDRKKIRNFYEARKFRPVWLKEGQGKVETLLSTLENSYKEGLNPLDYFAWEIKSRLNTDDHQARLERELLLTQAFFKYAKHISSGRLDPSKLRIRWYIKQEEVNEAGMLEEAIVHENFEQYLYNLSPAHPYYQGLKQLLASYRGDSAVEQKLPKIPYGSVLKPGSYDPRVIVLRKRLSTPLQYPSIAQPTGEIDEDGIPVQQQITVDLSASVENQGQNINHYYDGDIVEAVKKFQKEHGLKPDGVVGRRTLQKLNARKQLTNKEKIKKILVSMERWRWMPKELGSKYVFVNIPEFKLNVFEKESSVLNMKVIVGKTTTRTPSFDTKLTQLVVNPYWYVPRSIASKMAVSDESALNSRGYRVSYTNGGGIRLVQRPGPRNALGRLKFRMPNRHTIYLHDTPTKHLFNRVTRAFSHGCIRLGEPRVLAAYLMGEDWSTETVTKHINKGRNKNFNLPMETPVYLSYFTAKVDAEGQPHFFKDLYGYDRKIQAVLETRDKQADKLYNSVVKNTQ